ncbi:MAG: pirin family protein [Candidatus Eisenbacteria bacterium]|uniref:Pirin family protein n=1 Tax=Eiseniibacteriota bacterium TaxID=2212470 RepID=A0A948RX19_UNCEI|nr:pirin family protein [Candidatus Eisenbacteria bacterium]MBU1948803.1 pirin family protein [Candidatus Eisenbacteria bacterium]MBU2692430.1 pirin family protein [Candidatus Eisenbacteria bacterium]
MQNPRNIAKVIRPISVLEGAGVRLKRSFPAGAIDFIDPFLLLDDFSSSNPNDYRKGFPWHPHRGIETVSYVIQGAVNHGDSLGNRGTIGAGEAQWMTAGSGIMHEEMPDPQSERLVAFQLWVNLSADRKMTVPRYQNISSDSIPVVSPQKGVTVRVVAGEVDGMRGPVTGISIEPTYLDALLLPNASFTHSVPRGHTAMVYLFEGEAGVGPGAPHSGKEIVAPSLVILGDGDGIELEATTAGARCLLISGTPLNEPVSRYGPFVMNTPEEIQRALSDLNDGTFIRHQPEDHPS